MNRLPGMVRQHLAALRGLLRLHRASCGIAYPVVMVGSRPGGVPQPGQRLAGQLPGACPSAPACSCQEFAGRQGQPAAAVLPAAPSNAVNAAVEDRLRLQPAVLRGVQPGPEQPGPDQLIKQRQQQIAALDHVKISQIPADAVTASASGLTRTSRRQDAAIQVNRVAAARHVSPAAGPGAGRSRTPRAVRSDSPGRAAG